jgi:hypothetical protein
MNAEVHGETGVVELNEAECLSLIGEEGVGRIGFIEGGRVYVFPVNYIRDGRAVAFRTESGSALQRAATSEVAFEVDGVHEPSRSGWSVLVRGVARVVTDVIDLPEQSFFRHGVAPWEPGPKGEWVRIVPSEITGRRVGPDI